MLKKCVSVLIAVLIVLSSLVIAPAAAAETTAASAQEVVDNGDVTVTGTNSLGAMLAAEYEEYEDGEDGEEENYSAVYAVEVEGSVARAELSAMHDAKLIVAIYEEDGMVMVGSGMTDVTAEDSIVELTLAINPMPQYFYIRAFLLDRYADIPMCKPYENDYYTREMQEFFAKTTDDFEEEKVLNLDDNEENNFLVYGDDTIVIENDDESSNVVTVADDTAKKYVIENIDDSIAGLQPGDIFSYNYGEDDLLIVRVASIVINGTTATITGDDMELEEAFDYIRIDASQTAGEAEVDNSHLDEGVEFVGTEEPSIAPTGVKLDDKLSFSTAYDYKLDNSNKDSNIKGNIGLKLAVELTAYYDAELFQPGDIKFSFTVKHELSLSITMALEGELFNLELGDYFYMPLPCISIGITPSFIIEGKIEFELKGTLTGQVGKKFENGKFTDNSKKPTFDASVSVSGELLIGLSFEPNIRILGKVITASVEAKTGVKIKVSLSNKLVSSEDTSERHLCNVCLSGEISFVFNLSFKLSVLEIDNLTWKAAVVDYTKKLSDFYFSVDNREFGLSQCPHKGYKTVVTLLDPNQQPISGVSVNGASTNRNGQAVIYLAAGAQDIVINKDNKELTYQETIEKASAFQYTVDFTKTSGNTVFQSGAKVDAVKDSPEVKSGQWGENVFWSLKENGTLYFYGTGDMAEKTNWWETAPWGTDITKVVINYGVTSICEHAFYKCRKLNSIIIPQSVTKIGASAFYGCESLTSITIPKSVTRIENYTFSGCISLTNIAIHDKVTSIGSFAFEYCINLASVTIPNSVTSIYLGAFSYCTSLKSVTIPKTVTTIEKYAFGYLLELGNFDKKLDNFVIYGYAGSAGQTYANDNGFTFIALSDTATTGAAPAEEALAVESETDIAAIGAQGMIAAAGGETADAYTCTREHLVPGSEAVLLILADNGDDTALTPDSLLYIAQQTVPESGTAEIAAYGNFDSGDTIALIIGECDHSSVTWTTVREASGKNSGLKICTCDYCGEVVEAEVIPAPESVLRGDANADGEVDIVDVTFIQRYLAHFPLPSFDMDAADADEDGSVSVTDATRVQRWLAKM